MQSACSNIPVSKRSIVQIRICTRLAKWVTTMSLIIFSQLAIAQGHPSIHTSLSSSTILLGQQTEFTVELSLPRELGLNGWFNYPDTFNHLEILKRQKMDTVTQNDNILYRQKMVITGFDSGRWVIPSMSVDVAGKKVKTDTLSLFIMPVSLKDSSYHDIKEIIPVPELKTPWWYWILGAITLAVLVAAALYFLKRKKPLIPQAKEDKIKLSPYEQARQSLVQLKKEQWPENGEWKKYYSELQDILRVYVQRRYGVGALQKTTSELLIQLRGAGITEDPLSRIAESLRIGDAVKFAKYEPGVTVAAESFDIISNAIENLERIKPA